MQPPSYFESIRRRASERWDQLERDPELAGPWHQLFRQVQSPRHVVSELLQNADDAGAKSASVRIEDNTFIFEHDGDDFDGNRFAVPLALNKRTAALVFAVLASNQRSASATVEVRNAGGLPKRSGSPNRCV